MSFAICYTPTKAAIFNRVTNSAQDLCFNPVSAAYPQFVFLAVFFSCILQYILWLYVYLYFSNSNKISMFLCYRSWFCWFVFQQLVACSMLTALLNEYSSSSRTSSVGFTWEFHTKCKRAFEVNNWSVWFRDITWVYIGPYIWVVILYKLLRNLSY